LCNHSFELKNRGQKTKHIKKLQWDYSKSRDPHSIHKQQMMEQSWTRKQIFESKEQSRLANAAAAHWLASRNKYLTTTSHSKAMNIKQDLATNTHLCHIPFKKIKLIKHIFFMLFEFHIYKLV
jgi:hypothetical protein